MTEIIKKQLTALKRLQKKEMKIKAVEQDLDSVTQHIDDLSTQIAEFEAQVIQSREALNVLKKQYRANESDVQMIEQQIAKSEEKLRAVKTNKEYQSTLREIDNLKRKASEIEDQMLESLDKIESIEVQVKIKNADLKDFKAEIEEKQEAIRQTAAQQSHELQYLIEECDTVWNKMEASLQDFYTKVKRQSRGIAVAAVKDEICQVCMMNIPPQLYNELLRMEKLLTCPNCQRIIYPQKAMEETIAVEK